MKVYAFAGEARLHLVITTKFKLLNTTRFGRSDDMHFGKGRSHLVIETKEKLSLWVKRSVRYYYYFKRRFPNLTSSEILELL